MIRCPGCKSEDVYRVVQRRASVELCCFPCGRRWTVRGANRIAKTIELPNVAQRRATQRAEVSHENRAGRPGESHD